MTGAKPSMTTTPGRRAEGNGSEEDHHDDNDKGDKEDRECQTMLNHAIEWMGLRMGYRAGWWGEVDEVITYVTGFAIISAIQRYPDSKSVPEHFELSVKISLYMQEYKGTILRKIAMSMGVDHVFE